MAMLGAGKVILHGADAVVEALNIPPADRPAVYGAAAVLGVAVDPVGTAFEVGRRVLGVGDDGCGCDG